MKKLHVVDRTPEPSGPLAHLTLVQVRQVGSSPGHYYQISLAETRPYVPGIEDTGPEYMMWLTGPDLAVLVRKLKWLIGGVSIETGFKLEPGAIMTPTKPSHAIQIGSFGSLYHDEITQKIVDTFQSGDGAAVRYIDLPSGSDFHLLSGGLLVYSWNEASKTGAWYGSEKIRRERDLPMRPPSEVSSRGGKQGELHSGCSNDDHPEGCRARAAQAGFGCLVD